MLHRYIMKHLRASRWPAWPGLRAGGTQWAQACALAAAVPLAWAAGEAAPDEARPVDLTEPAAVLALLNAQRAAGAVCGNEVMPPAPPLQWHAAMERAALDHLLDVAGRPALSHVGQDGSSVGGRVWRHGYVWGGVAENIAGGHRGAADTLRLWLASPSHCRTLMGARYDHVAVVGRHVPGSRLRDYWVMVVARPLR
ncbi:MAG: hypothetical protein C0505_13205 [Leptothrix sp. (in: Bacteria)]|nr:hypothetical protein [Leptothrix sp. (in: b-proteobacteria)]